MPVACESGVNRISQKTVKATSLAFTPHAVTPKNSEQNRLFEPSQNLQKQKGLTEKDLSK